MCVFLDEYIFRNGHVELLEPELEQLSKKLEVETLSPSEGTTPFHLFMDYSWSKANVLPRSTRDF